MSRWCRNFAIAKQPGGAIITAKPMRERNVKTTILDKDAGVVYVFVASRLLTETEANQYLLTVLANRKKSKKPKRGQTVTVFLAI